MSRNREPEQEVEGRMEAPANKKKKLLVTFAHNHIGGAMTALVNFVNSLDPSRYQVDLLFYEIRSPVRGIRPEVNVLPPAREARLYPGRFVDPVYLARYVGAQYLIRARHNELMAWQLFAQQACRYARRLTEHYDVALSFELGWPFYYTMKYVQADKKLVWHHNDYHAIGYHFPWDRKYFDQADGLVFVSQECREKFATLHPSYRSKCFFMPNIMAREPVEAKARAYQPEFPFDLMHPGLNLVTVARIYFATKGLDRVLDVFVRLREEGLLDRVRWMVIGKGDDMPRFREKIQAAGLEKVVYPVGAKENPLPYLSAFDAFLLPSRNEGKPVAITEAQILGLPPVVTRYASAAEQIENGVDGFIFENNDEALYQGLRDLVLHPEKLDRARQAVRSRSYTNEREIACFDQILEAVEQSGEGGNAHDFRHSAGV